MVNEGSNHGVVAMIQGEMENEVDADVEILGTSVVAARASMMLSDVRAAMAEEQVVMVHDERAAHVLGEQGGTEDRTREPTTRYTERSGRAQCPCDRVKVWAEECSGIWCVGQPIRRRKRKGGGALGRYFHARDSWACRSGVGRAWGFFGQA
ncbi:unnamed protein product [Ilex paraguariensis]|uniref:Uncharacterized protein n=1 Tax=Ilex paraguariensis TaxID=185542 RepID=A0ABC8T8R1_9AQUA